MADVAEEVVEETKTEIKPDAEESHESLETLYGEEEAPEAAVEQEQEELGEEEAATEVKEVATGEDKPDAGESDDLTDEQVAALPPAEKGQYKAMKAERGKRKTADALVATRDQEIKTLTGHVEKLMGMLQNPAQAGKEEVVATDEEAKTFWEAPEEFIAKALEGVTGTVGELSEAQKSLRYNMSESSAQSRHEDYGTNLGVLVAALKSHPNREEAKAYKDQIFASADPAEAAYQAGKQLSQKAAIAEAGGFDAYVEKLAADKVAALQEDAAETEADEVVASATALPKSMASRRGVGKGGKHLGPDYSKDVSLESLYDT